MAGALVQQIRSAVVELAGASHHGAFVVPGACPNEYGASETGAAVFLETIDATLALTGAKRHFGMCAVVVYGLWVFPGLRPNSSEEWWNFESDVLGTIKKEKRKSDVSCAALHPLEIVNKYYGFIEKSLNASSPPEAASSGGPYVSASSARDGDPT